MFVPTPCGEYRNRVTIESLSGTSQSATGQKTDVYVPQFQVWAKIEPVKGRNVEIAAARTKGRTLAHQVTMRYVSGIAPVQTRLNFGGRLFEIFSVLNKEERNIELELVCNEIAS